jgi:hypothetical protein
MTSPVDALGRHLNQKQYLSKILQFYGSLELDFHVVVSDLNS